MADLKVKISYERQKMQEYLTQVNDFFLGNFGLAKKKEKYLLKYDSESKEQYARRKEISCFYNFFRPMILLSASKPFSHKVSYGKDFPEKLEPFKYNFSDEGEGVLKFSFDVFVSALKNSGCGIAIDYNDNEKRPYSIMVPLNDIIGLWKKRDGSGKSYIDRVQFLMRNIGYNEGQSSEVYSEKLIEMIHPNIVRTYKVTEESNFNSEVNYVATERNRDIFGSFRNSIVVDNNYEEKKLDGFQRLPFHYFHASETQKKEYTLLSPPPFYDLSCLNKSHYNKQSDQDNIISISRYGLFFATGVNESEIKLMKDNKVDLGPFSILVSSNEQAKFGFAEHSGQAIKAGMEDILKVERSMTNLLSEFLNKKSIMETATEKTINEKNKNLFSVFLANVLEEKISDCFRDFMTFLNIDNKTEYGSLLSFSKDYDSAAVELRIQTLLKSRMIGDISLETFLEELQALGGLSSDVDISDEKKRVEAEDELALNPLDPEGNEKPEDDALQKNPKNS